MKIEQVEEKERKLFLFDCFLLDFQSFFFKIQWNFDDLFRLQLKCFFPIFIFLLLLGENELWKHIKMMFIGYVIEKYNLNIMNMFFLCWHRKNKNKNDVRKAFPRCFPQFDNGILNCYEKKENFFVHSLWIYHFAHIFFIM